ncbi:hypothetical protein T492DRAFT_886199 [Pavlovales sp. CCMP2436]|nr:hypothetical protein T492DRAFT_886199 [Pavlovales sp. CCMP2436]
MASERSASDARAIDKLVLQLNRESRLCFTGELLGTTCLSFKPAERFEQRSLAQAIGDISGAITAPENYWLGRAEEVQRMLLVTDAHCATIMLDAGAHVDQADLEGTTPLLAATRLANIEFLKLLNAGADVNRAD